MYSKCLEQVSLKLSGFVHSKDLKNRILSNIPDLKVYKNGRDKSLTLHKKWSFPLIISPVSVTKPAFFRRHWHFLVTFTKEILNGKLHFSCSVTFDEDIGIALKIVSEKHCADEAAILVKAAKFVWHDMTKHKYVFDGNFQTNYQKNSVPSSLFFHMSMVIRGSSIKVISDNVSVIQDMYVCRYAQHIIQMHPDTLISALQSNYLIYQITVKNIVKNCKN